MPKIQCLKPGCRKIIDKATGIYCPEHKDYRQSNKQPRKVLEHQRDKSGNYVYTSKRWKVISQKMLIIQPFCQHCWDNGIETLADIVDHIVELRDGADPYDKSNLECLCHSCHGRKTRRVAEDRKEQERIKRLGLYVV